MGFPRQNTQAHIPIPILKLSRQPPQKCLDLFIPTELCPPKGPPLIFTPGSASTKNTLALEDTIPKTPWEHGKIPKLPWAHVPPPPPRRKAARRGAAFASFASVGPTPRPAGAAPRPRGAAAGRAVRRRPGEKVGGRPNEAAPKSGGTHQNKKLPQIDKGVEREVPMLFTGLPKLFRGYPKLYGGLKLGGSRFFEGAPEVV